MTIFAGLYRIVIIKKEKLNWLKDCKRHLEKFSVEKDKNLREDGIVKLAENNETKFMS